MYRTIVSLYQSARRQTGGRGTNSPRTGARCRRRCGRSAGASASASPGLAASSSPSSQLEKKKLLLLLLLVVLLFLLLLSLLLWLRTGKGLEWVAGWMMRLAEVRGGY
jgi:hypothetical protein